MTATITEAGPESTTRRWPSGVPLPAYLPHAPHRLEELDVPEQMILDLAIRHTSVRGLCTIQSLGQLMRVPLEVAEAVFRRLNEQQLFEVRRMSGDDYVFSLSPSGRKMAAERGNSSKYAGAAPVSLKAYSAAVRAQTPQLDITRDKLRRALADIVVPDNLLDMLGPALISQGAIFLHGPSGTGKTTISERLIRAFEDPVVVPWAVEVDGQIIVLGDPAVHEPIAVEHPDVDPRWMICKRPFVSVGGELVTTMLDLQKDEGSGAFIAPLQMKANNGILLIDDFGRQLMSPRDLLNRWIVPLDRRVDFLSLGTGKFDIPFELLVVFSTNLAPQELADEAFLRRIPNKIFVPSAEADAFDVIFERCADGMGMGHEPGAAQALRELCLKHSPDLRPCFPRDICSLMRAVTRYEGRPPRITRADLERAVTAYFV